jgi:predicted acyl esterase
MADSVKPARHHETLPGRWVAERSWPPLAKAASPFLADDGLGQRVVAPRAVSFAAGRHQAGEWCPFGRGNDQAGDQREDDARSLVFDTPPLGRSSDPGRGRHSRPVRQADRQPRGPAVRPASVSESCA